MFKDRFSAAKEWVSREIERNRELQRFNQLFPDVPGFNGMLTQENHNIHPLYRGLAVSEHLTTIYSKLIGGKSLTAGEAREVREGAWLKSIGGTFGAHVEDGQGLNVMVILDTPDATEYLAENTGTMLAYLSHPDLQHGVSRHTLFSGVKTDGVGFNYNFQSLNAVPERMRLNIYTRPVDDSKINPRFLRLGLILLDRTENSQK